ncbi:MAG: hypothetical protein D6800_01700, partial [Candidatus Zixiibacteriota bacterium]
MSEIDYEKLADMVAERLRKAGATGPESTTATVAALPADEYVYQREPEALPDRTKMTREALANFRQAIYQLENAIAITREDERGAAADRDMALRGMRETLAKFLSEAEAGG